jgi:hypothetical protein
MILFLSLFVCLFCSFFYFFLVRVWCSGPRVPWGGGGGNSLEGSGKGEEGDG